jgi:hypothetical protein
MRFMPSRGPQAPRTVTRQPQSSALDYELASILDGAAGFDLSTLEFLSPAAAWSARARVTREDWAVETASMRGVPCCLASKHPSVGHL